MLNNIYQKSIDVNNLGKKHRQKSNALQGKNQAKNKIECPASEETNRKMSATILLVLGTLGCSINMFVVLLMMLSKVWRHHDRCGLGLVVHQCIVDCGRSAILFPLGEMKE